MGNPENRPESGTGQFRKGVSGNPGGRPKGVAAAVQARAGKDGAALIDALFSMAVGRAKDHKRIFGQALKPSVRDRRECLIALLDRGFGKPIQAHEHGGPDGAPIEIASYDVSKLTAEELTALRTCLAKAQPQS